MDILKRAELHEEAVRALVKAAGMMLPAGVRHALVEQACLVKELAEAVARLEGFLDIGEGGL